MKVEIPGTGCAKCRLLEERVEEVVKGVGRKDIEIVKVADGKVPSVKEIKEMLGGKKYGFVEEEENV